MRVPLIAQDGHSGRVLGWGFVVLLHLLMWVCLNHGAARLRVMPSLDAVRVFLIDEPALPVMTPPPASPQEAVNTEAVWVPKPEVWVREATAETTLVASASPPTDLSSPAEQRPEPTAAHLPLLSESEVDYLKIPEVRFPIAARRAREQGLVMLSVVIDGRGVVDRVTVFKSSGYQRLDEAAIRALRVARFRPYTRNGVAMAVEIRIPVEFSLSASV